MSLARGALATLRILLLGWIVILWVPRTSQDATTDRSANLAANPSFEVLKERDAASGMFADWEGEGAEGGCSIAVGLVAHTGHTSALLDCAMAGKIGIGQQRELAPGRYSIGAYLRGLDIAGGDGTRAIEFTFDGVSTGLEKTGTFGWTRFTFVAEIGERTRTGPSFELRAPGLLWIDDVSIERVGDDVELSAEAEWGGQEAPIAPPGTIGHGEVRCPKCRYRNMPGWKRCYACGTALADRLAITSGPAERIVASFERGNPFTGGAVVEEPAAGGQKALRIDRRHAAMRQPQDWSGYDLFQMDLYTDAHEPLPVALEFWDRGSTGYWNRVNYNAVAPPGASTLTVPLRYLAVGERNRSGRNLMLNAITRVVVAVGDTPSAPLFVSKLRLERDVALRQAQFDGLFAFALGGGPAMDGFTPITTATLYNPGRGYGLQDAHIWRAVDSLGQDPLYRRSLAIESGGLAVDVPNGKYRVYVNLDSPAGFWGEYQIYRDRSIRAQGKVVVSEHRDFASFRKNYFQFWDRDDLPSDDTFDKYDRAHFHEKVFDVTVNNGQLRLEFTGEQRACSVSAVVIFPVAKAAEGARFLELVREQRRFYFDDAFKRVLHRAAGDALQPTAEDTARGYVVFHRDFMRDVYYNDTPFQGERTSGLSAEAFAGQDVPATVSVLPLRDLGQSTVTVSALKGPQGAIPAAAIDVGYVSYRLSRVTMDGAVYTITPRLILARNSVDIPRALARRFWLTVRTPASAGPGDYLGQVTFTPHKGAPLRIPLRFTVRKGTLDAVDFPVGPFGGSIGVPWFDDDPDSIAFGSDLTAKSLRLLRARGFTMYSGIPQIKYGGFARGEPVLDFSAADREMSDAKSNGFLAVNSYGAGVAGLDAYHRDTAKMTAAGFTEYSAFIKAIYSAIERHAQENGWLPVYWNLGDEPIGDAIQQSIENATAYRSAFPHGPPFFTAALSLQGRGDSDPDFILARTLDAPALAGYSERDVMLLRQRGGGWAFYNGGNRWTYGVHLYKAAKEFGAKFRLSWHWNAAAGDPYYALDCREDDYAWANAGPEGQLVPSVEFARISAGLDDYRSLITVARLAQARSGTTAAKAGPRWIAAQQAAQRLIATRMAAFHLEDRDHDRLFGVDDWAAFRRQVVNAIEELQ
ncbi:MAG: hypothetical protein ACLQKA_23115 [Bryobacteraceae bacterium]